MLANRFIFKIFPNIVNNEHSMKKYIKKNKHVKNWTVFWYPKYNGISSDFLGQNPLEIVWGRVIWLLTI